MTSGSLTVLTAVTGRWEAPLVAGLERSGSTVQVVRRCVDLGEVLSAASAGLARAVILSADLQRLDRDAVRTLLGAGVAVVGLVEPGDPAAQTRLANLGVPLVLPADAPIDDVAAAVTLAVQQLAERTSAAGPVQSAPAGEVVPRGAGAGGPDEPGPGRPGSGEPQAEPPEPAPSGRLVAVWGPTGAPGRTTVAVTLAAELAAAGEQTLLIDADTYGASVAQALGMLDESAALAAAARAANQGSLDPDRLMTLAPEVSDRLQVLTGLPQPRRWPELRAAALEVVWQHARQLCAWTVVDCGFALDADEEISFDTAVPRRNAATRSALQAADLVVAVGSCDPVGLQRLVRGLQDLAGVVPPGQPLRVVVTRLRAGSVGGAPAERVLQALERYAGVQSAVLVPDDRPSCDAAMLAGRSLTEHAPGSPARQVLAGLAAEIAGRPAGRARRHGSIRKILRAGRSGEKAPVTASRAAQPDPA